MGENGIHKQLEHIDQLPKICYNGNVMNVIIKEREELFMKFKKLITGMLLIVIFMAQISIIPFNNFVYAEEAQNNTKFHYQQLDEVAKKIYHGICDMYEQGIMKTGTESFDLTKDDKYVTQEQLESYMKGNSELKKAMSAARYAFYVDHPEVFYVNFPNLNLRVTKDAENRYHANIGSGSLKSYYVEGFTSKEQVEEAIQAFDTRIDEIVNGARNLEVEEGKNVIIEQVKYVHNEIIYNTSYRLESDCEEGNEGFLGTPYGALVKKQAVCEGYARALKVILDKIGINCILVQGTHQTDGSAALPHMWNYVEVEKETNARAIEKVWYAVDATIDDPFLRDTTMDKEDQDFKPGDDIVEGFENTRYCMVGTETMNREHTPIETVEAAGNYKFKYPELHEEDYGIDAVTNNNGLLVKFKQEGTQTEEYKAGDFYISYNGKGYAKAKEEGKYILMKYHEYRPGDELWLEGKWGYMDPEPYAGGFKDYDDHIYITVPNGEYVEFAVTTLAPSSGIAGLTYQGDESDFVAQSGKLYNPNGIYKARPYVKKQTPPATQSLTVGPTYHVDVTYDDDLVLAEGATEVGFRMESTGSTGAEKSEITNFQFDGKNRITFDLKFSQMYADDGANYHICPTGLVGKNSGKEPMDIVFGAINLIGCSYSMNKAKNWEVFATPTLMENEDLSLNGWQTSDGESVSDKLRSRIALVTTRTTKAENDAMNNLMENELPNQELITSQTYNISLNVCKKYVVKTGHRLRLSLGFPEGYGPDDAGVTFKAYHFMRDDQGNVTGVEEIPCVITPYGLIVTCDSFSPFAVAVVENDGTVEQNKSVIISASEGGKITGANREEGNIITLEPNQSRTISVQADEGYEIETLTVCGEKVDMTQIANKDVMDLSVAYNDIKDGNCIVEATFVAKAVIASEEQKGEVAVQPTVTPATATIPTERMASLNRPLVINSNVAETEGTYTYQWYKDGVKLEGKTNKTLTIDSVAQTDAGKYTLKVTTTVGTTSEETTSNECTVTVRGFGISIVSKDETVDLEKLEPGTEFEVNVNIDNMTNIGKGIISLTGQLEYDTNILERISVTGANGWSLENNSFNEQNFKFITDNDKYITEESQMFTMKFKVKDTITENTKTSIKIKGITASGGYGIIGTKDAELAVAVEIPEEPVEEKITSDVYVINDQDKDISRILPETTVEQFKQNVTTEQEMVFIDKEGNTLGEQDIIGTGMTIKVGETLEYTLVVTGDLDGDGEITINDLAKVKLHLIEFELLTGIHLKAADVDYDKEITVNDAARIKLVLIDLMEIE